MFSAILRLLSVLSNLWSFPVFCAYLLIVALSGKITKRCKPLDLRQIMVWYNGGCSLAGVLVVGLFIRGYWAHEYESIFDKNASPTFNIAFLAYAGTKWIELLDTVFMILRHRHRQISFLHVYHHSSILLLGDLTYSRYPWTGIAPFLLLNQFVHIWLYLYYALSAGNPGNPPKWKKQLTQLQILQFVLGMFLSTNGYLYHGFCMYGPLYGLTMTLLFSHFYVKAYCKQKKIKL